MAQEPRPGEHEAPMSVTQLLRRMRNLLEIQIGKIWVEGEISNLRRQPSGHWYFSLKDEDAQISCVMFGAKRREGAGSLEDGNRVRVQAEASIYEARGQLQVVVLKAESAGEGDLQRRFENLKKKLQAEGLFDQEQKKAIPGFPKTIGIVTSGSGAALQDILNVLGRRAPWVQPVLLPVRVQGKGTEREIARAIRELGRPEDFGHPRCDVLIVGRGGGSLEDLWNFNEELVARAIWRCPIPVISAVGHEIDFTIADFVADLRAPTPSAAAELAVADGGELSQRLGQLRTRLARPAESQLRHATAELATLRSGLSLRSLESRLRELAVRVDMYRDGLRSGIVQQATSRVRDLEQIRLTLRSHHPERVLERRGGTLDSLRKRLQPAAKMPHRRLEERLSGIAHTFRALGPDSAFERGFSITTDSKGRIVRSVKDLRSGSNIQTRLADGTVTSKVTKATATSRDGA